MGLYERAAMSSWRIGMLGLVVLAVAPMSEAAAQTLPIMG
jgi:hypothetical protein